MTRVILFFRKLATAGGAERTMFEEALCFQRHGIETAVLTFSLDPRALFEPPYPVFVRQIGSIPKGVVRALFAEMRNIVSLRRAILRMKPDIVLASSGIDCLPLYWATLGLATPYATHIHGTIFWFDATYRTSLLRYASIHRGVYHTIRESVIGHREFVPARPPSLGPIKRFAVEIGARALAAAIRKARVIFTLTRHMAWEVKTLYGRDAIPIKGGVARRLFTHASSGDIRRRLRLENKRVVLNVNRLDARKRVDLAIRAFHRISADHSDLCLVIGGTGPDEDRLKELTRHLNLDGKVLFVGYIPDDQLPDYLAMCDVFVHPNWAEFAISPYEALAMQRKVVWSTEMEMDDDIADDRHVFAAEPTVEAFAVAMQRALDADVRTATDLSRYTWEAYTERVLLTLDQALPSNKR